MTDPVPSAPAVREPVTDDIVRRLDAALEATKGNRSHAAQVLGWTIHRVNNIVHLRPQLKAKWTKKEVDVPAPGLATDIHREIGVAPFANSDQQIAEAVKAEDDLWQNGLDRLRFTPEKKDFLGAIMSTHGNHWVAVTHMFQGGVSYTATELLFMFHKLEKEIADTLANPANYDRHAYSASGDKYVVKAAHEFRMEMMDRALSIAEMFRKLNSDSERAQLIAAQVEKMKVNEAKTVKQRKRGAWEATTPEKTANGPVQS